MASLRDIQHKISGVKKTKQITKAMNMVASAKLRGAQNRIERFRPYAEKYRDVLAELAERAGAEAHPLLASRDQIKTVGIVLITPDKGLCGSFNAQLCATANRLAKSLLASGKQVKFLCIGKKGADFIKRLGYVIVESRRDQMTNFDFQLAANIGDMLIDGYISATFDEIQIVYGQFINIARQKAIATQLLPVKSNEKKSDLGSTECLFEPSVGVLLEKLVPQYVRVQVYQSLLDTVASECAARMTAMDNATKNCDELVGTLTLIYNKARQTSITTQLMDIVGGAEALKG